MQTWFVLAVNGAFLSVLMNADVSKIVWNVYWRQTACCSRYKSFYLVPYHMLQAAVAATTDGAPAPYKGCISGRTRSLSSRLRFGMEHWCAELTTPLASRPELRMSRTSWRGENLAACLTGLGCLRTSLHTRLHQKLADREAGRRAIMDKANSPTNATGNDFFMVVSLHLAQAHRLSRAHTVPQCRTHVQ